MSTGSAYQRFISRDPLLIAALHSGDARTIAATIRLLRLTPLRTLASHPGALVDVLVGVPEAHERLRSTWGSQEPELTSTLFAWAAQARLRIDRQDPAGSRSARAAAARSAVRAEEIAFS